MRMFLALIIFFVIFGCHSNDFSEKNLAGNYTANHGKCKDQFELKADGTYLHYFTKSGKEMKHGGRWVLENNDGNAKIMLKGFYPALAGYCGESGCFFHMAIKTRSKGQIILIFDVNKDYYYRK